MSRLVKISGVVASDIVLLSLEISTELEISQRLVVATTPDIFCVVSYKHSRCFVGNIQICCPKYLLRNVLMSY